MLALPAAHADDASDAKTHYQKATAHYAVGEYKDAAAEYEAAYKAKQDPALLYTLGVLCEREQLWGKAQTYFEASLALDDSWRTRVALGELLAKLDRGDDANAHLATALKLAIACSSLSIRSLDSTAYFDVGCSLTMFL